MSNITAKLVELNALRTAKGQAPLKSWKGSEASLDQTLTAYKTKKVEPAVAEGAYANGREAEHRTGLKGKDAKKREAIRKANAPKVKASKVKASKPAKAAKVVKAKATGEFVLLSDIARKLDIEPKVARAKCRRSDAMIKLSKGDQWQFLPKDQKAVVAFLTTDQRKAEK